MTRVGNFPTGGALTQRRTLLLDGVDRPRLQRHPHRLGAHRAGRPDRSAARRVRRHRDGPDAARRLRVRRRRLRAQGPAAAGRAGPPGRRGPRLPLHQDRHGRARPGTIPVPPPSDSPDPQDFPPTDTVGKKVSWPDRLAVSRDGRTLLVPLNLADRAAIVDVASKGVRYVATGSYPYGAAILRDGRTGLVLERDRRARCRSSTCKPGRRRRTSRSASHLSHPEAIALDPRADRAYVAIANTDQVAVIDTRQLVVERTLSVGRPEGNGTSPVALTVTPDGSQLVVAEAGADELAVFQLPNATRSRSSALQRRAAAVLTHEARTRVAPRPADYSLVGRIPVASYPADVQVAPASANPCTAAAQAPHHRLPKRRAGHRRQAQDGQAAHADVRQAGVGGREGPGGRPQPERAEPLRHQRRQRAGAELPAARSSTGSAGALDYPSTARIRALTPAASTQLRPANAEAAPPGTPLRAGRADQARLLHRQGEPHLRPGPRRRVARRRRPEPGPLRPPGDAQPPRAGRAVRAARPRLRQLRGVDRRALLGQRGQGLRLRPQELEPELRRRATAPTTSACTRSPGRATASSSTSSSARASAGSTSARPSPAWSACSRTRTARPRRPQQVNAKFAKSDLGAPFPAQCFPNDAFIFKNEHRPEHDVGRLAAGRVPGEHGVAGRLLQAEVHAPGGGRQRARPSPTSRCPMDHTEGATPGHPTPRAYVANNDYGARRRSSTRSRTRRSGRSSAIFVIEDDSQDGADHVDAHRIPAFVICPTRSAARSSTRATTSCR